MGFNYSLNALFALKTEAGLSANNAAVLTTVTRAFLMPYSQEEAKLLSSQWRYCVNGVAANILGIACADLVKQHKGDKERKDGSASIVHEYTQMHYLRMLLARGFNIDRPDLIAAVIAIHDLGEDYDLKTSDIRKHLKNYVINMQGSIDPQTKEDLFADIEIIVDSFLIMSREIKGEKAKLEKFEYIQQTLHDPIASITKPFDRIHNMCTPSEGESDKKVKETYALFLAPVYRIEGEKDPLNYFEAAKILHPQHADIYDNLYHTLKTAHDLRAISSLDKGEIARKGTAVFGDIRGMVPEGFMQEMDNPIALQPITTLVQRIDP